MVRWFGLLSALLLGLGLQMIGCNQPMFGSKDGNITRLTPRTVPYLTGVPVPSGFTLAERMTDAYESGGLRFARQEYIGYAEPYAVCEFYREQMPPGGWREVSTQNVKGRTSIRFEDSNEECTVTIEPAGAFNRTSIQVVVKPFNRNSSESPSKRAMP